MADTAAEPAEVTDAHGGRRAPDRDPGRRRGRGHPLTRPAWLVANVIVLAVLVTFPQLGQWQWQRYREEQALSARVDDRLDADPVPVSSVLEPDLPASEVAAREFTPVTASGTWVADEQVAQRNRSLDGNGGFDLLTPLDLGDGTAVLVRRGWVPPDGTGSPDPAPDEPVTGRVTVTGWLEAGVDQPTGLGARDADTGVLDTVFHADLDRLDRQTGQDLLPMLVHLVDQQPGDGDLPIPQPPPVRDATQNLSYALQWYAFTVIVVGGYAIVLWRRLRDHRAGVDSDVDPLLRDREA